MKVLMCRVGEAARVEEIDNGLESMQNVVGGYIQATYPFEDEVAIICNEEGKLMGLEANRGIPTTMDIIVGDFFICGLGDDDFTDIPEELIDKYEFLMDIFMIEHEEKENESYDTI